jgi:hypothetical protein
MNVSLYNYTWYCISWYEKTRMVVPLVPQTFVFSLALHHVFRLSPLANAMYVGSGALAGS